MYGLGAVVALLLCATAVAQTPAPPASAPPTVPASAAPAANAGPPSLDDFYADAKIGSARLSPDGRYVAYVETYAEAKKASAVIVENLETQDAKPIFVDDVKDVTLDWLEWKDNTRLIVGVTLQEVKRVGDKPTGDVESYRYGQFLFAMDRDGKNLLQLLKGNFWNSRRGSMVELLDRLKDQPDYILATAPDVGGNSDIWKINIHTGDAVKIEGGTDGTYAWRTDSTGAVLVRYRRFGRSTFIEGRPNNDAKWSKISIVRDKDLKVLDDYEFLGAAEKPSQFYYAVKPKDKSEGDVRRLRIYDVVTKTLSDPIWPALKYDIDNIVYDGDTDRLAGVCYTSDVYTCDFVDGANTAHFRGLSKYFHGDRNISAVSYSDDGNWWLLHVTGPDEPSSYYLYDKSTASIDLLAERFPQLSSDRLAVMQRFAYTARDGASIPAYLTRPKTVAAGPLPLIVMPHGGPEARDSFEFDVWTQFLATRGYLVFQPNFRGSGGYGVSYEDAGHKQWGGRMADDITDGVRALIASGQADPNRICIFGASYGGYAALYAGATHPELYKCVVSWAGLSDLSANLQLLRDNYGKDSADYQYWTSLIGDPDKDADLIKAASPVTYAQAYKPPVLLIHGEDDGVVDVDQSKLMNRALKRAGRDVQLIIFKNEGHPHFRDENDKAALTDIINFIEAHIAPAALAKPPSGPPAPTQSVASTEPTAKP